MAYLDVQFYSICAIVTLKLSILTYCCAVLTCCTDDSTSNLIHLVLIQLIFKQGLRVFVCIHKSPMAVACFLQQHYAILNFFLEKSCIGLT